MELTIVKDKIVTTLTTLPFDTMTFSSPLRDWIPVMLSRGFISDGTKISSCCKLFKYITEKFRFKKKKTCSCEQAFTFEGISSCITAQTVQSAVQSPIYDVPRWTVNA